MKFGDREIKDFTLPYIIAEVGANHNGDMNLAKEMIASAKSCGCDAVKFQSWTPESLIAKEEYDRNQQYNDSPKKHFGSLKEMVEKYYLRPEQHIELKQYCDNIGIEFCSSPFSMAEADLLDTMNVPFYKIASMDINNLNFLEYIARKRKPIILSTGMASLSEIETAVKTIADAGNTEIILLHCIAIYPPVYEDINLNNIKMLRKTFGYPVGFSDHSIGVSIPLAAVALGSCVIEKHFTLDKDLPGWDHEISADPNEMKTIVLEARNVTTALGSYRRIVNEAELDKRKKFRRSIVIKKDLISGHILTEEDITFKRPGTQIPPDQKVYVLGRRIMRDLAADDVLRWEDLM